jgi:hypothetical protein
MAKLAQIGDAAPCRGHTEWSTDLLELGLDPKRRRRHPLSNASKNAPFWCRMRELWPKQWRRVCWIRGWRGSWVDQVPFLVDQFSFLNSFNISPNLNLNSNRKTRDKFLDSNPNSNLELHFMCYTWAHTLQLTLVCNTVTHLKLRRAWTKYLQWHSKLGFSVRITPLKSTSNLDK